MHATHAKTHPRSHSRAFVNLLPEVTMWGGPRATHIYIHVPNIAKEQLKVEYPFLQAVGKISLPGSVNDLIRIVLPKHAS